MATVLYAAAAELATLGNTFTVDGTATDPTTVTLTVTDPTGTTTTYTYGGSGTITKTATGVYSLDVPVPTAGLWLYAWTGTGTASDLTVGSFHVEPPGLPPIVSLADTKTWLRITNSDDDGELLEMLLAWSEIAEEMTGQVWRRRTLTETYSSTGSTELRLQHRPIESVTTVTENGVTLDTSGYTSGAENGILYRGSGIVPLCWLPGRAHITVTYVAAPLDGIVPVYIRRGLRLGIQHTWATQRGASGLPRQSGNAGEVYIDPRTGYSFPRRVLELWSVAPLAGPMVG